MENKRRSSKKKGPQIRDLKNINLKDLRPGQAHVIKGGLTISCGSPGDQCDTLTVVVQATDLHISISRFKATRAKSTMR